MVAKTFTRSELEQLREKVRHWLEFHPEKGAHRLDREVFLNEAVFELEMRHLFEGGWVYLAHESQIPNANDFLTTYIGRQPVIVTRDAQGEFSCLANACSHRGARVCRVKQGTRRTFTCSFHGWVYDNHGRNLDVRGYDAGGYLPKFERRELGLPRARIESYRGFLFGSLNPDVPALETHLAGSKYFIDLILDQSPTGKVEVIPGRTTYTYNGNWKLAAENGVDGYHGPTVHASYITAAKRRMADPGQDVKVLDLSAIEKADGGFFYFGRGHAALWASYLNFQSRPNYVFRDQFMKSFGAEKTQWIIEQSRNLLLYPNVFLMDTSSNQIRIIRPISLEKTEVTTYCFGPEGEAADSRAMRIRQYEDFFNASGMATPDDLAEFTNCQQGFHARASKWSDLSRGAANWKKHPDGNAGKGVPAVMSGGNATSEGLYVGLHGYWIEEIDAAIEIELTRAPS